MPGLAYGDSSAQPLSPAYDGSKEFGKCRVHGRQLLHMLIGMSVRRADLPISGATGCHVAGIVME